MAHKASNIHYLAFYKQSLLFPVVEPSPAHRRELLELFSFSPFSLSKVEKKGWRRIGKRETRVANCLFPFNGNSSWNWPWVSDWDLTVTWRSKENVFPHWELSLVQKMFLSSWKALYVTTEVNSSFLITVIIGRDHENLPSERSTAIPGRFCQCWYWFQLKQVISVTGLPVGCTHCPVMQMESLFQTYAIWLLTTRPGQLGV